MSLPEALNAVQDIGKIQNTFRSKVKEFRSTELEFYAAQKQFDRLEEPPELFRKLQDLIWENACLLDDMKMELRKLLNYPFEILRRVPESSLDALLETQRASEKMHKELCLGLESDRKYLFLLTGI
ncbi:hypothetical protein SCHPADRAFT_887781 [Schizopora paradoxa]|uniref:Uncharacterized protein n=1 Tax=Schizopora paradoxa TaxID=27342 RepID=A0A0H2RXW5_9AGAM|nr:hypothetical protein SCHPADRAFT_887781 [Schizopora paradoxa]